MSERLEKFKRRMRQHLEREGKLVTDMKEANLSPEEDEEMISFMVDLAKEIADKYPAYRMGLANFMSLETICQDKERFMEFMRSVRSKVPIEV
jgi:hypothetical protein